MLYVYPWKSGLLSADKCFKGVCKEEKAARDECLLYSETGPEKCAPEIAAYKQCMAGFGFKI